MIPACKLTLQQGTKNSNISYRDSEAEMLLIYGGYLAKVLQYISKGSREMAICVAIYKNEGTKGEAKAIVASGLSTHVRRDLPSRIL